MSFFKAIPAAWTVAAFLLVPSAGHGQATELPIAIGDSVRVSLPAISSRTGETDEPRVFVGAVRQVEGRCIHVVARTDSGRNDKLIVLMREGYELHRIWPEPSVITGATLAEYGIECLEIRLE